MEIVYILIGIAVGAVVAGLIVLNQKKGVESQLALSRQQLDQQQTLCGDLKAQLTESRTRQDELAERCAALREEASALSASLQKEKENTDRQAEQQQRQFDEQLKTVQEKFTNLAAEVLEKTQDKLQSGNQTELKNITAPLRENITQLQEAINKTNTETARSTASLTEQLKQMAARTDKIDQTATRLTNVMRGGNQQQGSWGERMLTDILLMAGLQEGIDFDVQQVLRDEKGNILLNEETGQQMKPDVILHYPDNEDVIIDSKMSIDAYYRYVNTDHEDLRKQYADELAHNVRANVNLLSKKNYSDYVAEPRHTIDFVIMFVPNDGALALALETDKRLWADAFDKRVFITGQQNLMAILKMIQMAWRQYQQTQNQQKVYQLAEELLKRVGDFYSKFKRMNDQIDALRQSYDEVSKKVVLGKQSIAQKANQLKELGVKENAKYPLPETTTDPLQSLPTDSAEDASPRE